LRQVALKFAALARDADPIVGKVWPSSKTGKVFGIVAVSSYGKKGFAGSRASIRGDDTVSVA
jgi:hypothetical protein